MNTKQSSSLLGRLLRPTLIRIKQTSEQDFYKDIIGLFLLASSLFLIFIMASFNPKDPSPFTVSIPSHQATNFGGIVGASASGTIFLLYRCLWPSFTNMVYPFFVVLLQQGSSGHSQNTHSRMGVITIYMQLSIFYTFKGSYV